MTTQIDAYLRLRRVLIETRRVLEDSELYEFSPSDREKIQDLIELFKFTRLDMPLGSSLESHIIDDNDPRLKVPE